MIEGDSIKPRAEAASTLERREPGQDFDEDLLRCILGIFRMEQHTEGDVVDPRLMAFDQILKCLAIAGASSRNKILILGFARSIVGEGVIHVHHLSPGGSRHRRSRGSQGLRHGREVAAHDLPVTTLFDKH